MYHESTRHGSASSRQTHLLTTWCTWVLNSAPRGHACGAALPRKSVIPQPHYRVAWLHGSHRRHEHALHAASLRGPASVPGQWQRWHLGMLRNFTTLHLLLRELLPGYGSRPADAGTDGSMAPPAAGSSQRQAQWGHLLQLQQHSRWVEAAAAFSSKWPDVDDATDAAIDQLGSSSSQQQADVGRLYEDALELCKALVAPAPLPLVCNNPGCGNLAGRIEVALARKVCACCRCRYCSAACQEADWRRHRRACTAMAAAGLVCS
ncbi:hypothetical protein COO60DRAFT_32697 [Scenedesmus sp. NREL 46B-D3]|nr:hypothetical protein COO60DRAFT_32697 [Scenedesmus sp. NREL 46B-D3]